MEARIWLGKSTTAELNLKTSALVSRFISVDLIKYLGQKRKEKETQKKKETRESGFIWLTILVHYYR